MTTIFGPGPGADVPDLDPGPDGEIVRLFVFRNYRPGESDLEGRSDAFAEAVFRAGLHLVELTATMDRSGFWTAHAMHADDAARFPIGSKATLVMRSGRDGFMEHVALVAGHPESEMTEGVPRP